MKKSLKNLVFAALMTALCIVVGWICRSLSASNSPIRITFENLPVIFTGIALGPIWGAAVGAASDIISALLSGFGINPVITLGAGCVGLFSGVFAKYIFKSRKFMSIYASSLVGHIIGSMTVKTLGLSLYGYSWQLLLVRIPLYLVIGSVEAYLIYIIIKNKSVQSLFGGKK